MFLNVIKNQNLSISTPNKPTYWPSHPNRQPDMLDFFITSISNSIDKQVENLYSLSSDHSPIILRLNCNTTPTQKNSQTNALTNFETFKTKMNEKLTLNIKLKSKDDLDNVVQHFVTTTQESILLASKKTNLNNKKIFVHGTFHFDQKINSQKTTS